MFVIVIVIVVVVVVDVVVVPVWWHFLYVLTNDLQTMIERKIETILFLIVD